MTSKVMTSGKHALTVRVEESDYKKMRILAAELNMSVNEMIARFAVEMTEKKLKRLALKKE